MDSRNLHRNRPASFTSKALTDQYVSKCGPRSHARQSRKSLRFGSRPEQKKKNPAPIGALYMRNPFLWRLAERALERSTRASIGKARLTAGPSLRSRKEDLNDQIAS